MKIISFRRYYLDSLLATIVFYGNVLDIGGKKINKRGGFQPPLDKVNCWDYLNVDAKTMPDILCSAVNIKVDKEYDFVLMNEVLEYIDDYQLALEEAFRVIKINGSLIMSVPFLFPIHRDEGDRHRFTKFELMEMLKKAGFNSINIQPMGSLFSVIYDILLIAYGYGSGEENNFFNKLLRNRLLPLFFWLFLFLDKRSEGRSEWITSGYFINASK